MIDNTRTDLEDRLETVDARLKSVSSQRNNNNNIQNQEERNTTTQCLKICTEVSIHIDQVRLGVLTDISTPSNTSQGPVTTLDGLLSAQLATDTALAKCKTTLEVTSTQLEKRLQDLDASSRKQTGNESVVSEIDDDELQRSQSDYDSVKKALEVCSEASERATELRINQFEDVTMAEDGNQIIVSTIGDLISAKRINAGARSNQWLGQMSDQSLQGMTNAFGHVSLAKVTDDSPEAGTAFSRFGAGFKLNKNDSATTDGAKANLG
jgi:hypothetical protein